MSNYYKFFHELANENFEYEMKKDKKNPAIDEVIKAMEDMLTLIKKYKNTDYYDSEAWLERDHEIQKIAEKYHKNKDLSALCYNTINAVDAIIMNTINKDDKKESLEKNIKKNDFAAARKDFEKLRKENLKKDVEVDGMFLSEDDYPYYMRIHQKNKTSILAIPTISKRYEKVQEIIKELKEADKIKEPRIYQAADGETNVSVSRYMHVFLNHNKDIFETFSKQSMLSFVELPFYQQIYIFRDLRKYGVQGNIDLK